MAKDKQGKQGKCQSDGAPLQRRREDLSQAAWNPLWRHGVLSAPGGGEDPPVDGDSGAWPVHVKDLFVVLSEKLKGYVKVGDEQAIVDFTYGSR